ncbi:MAG: type II toxin-antitoxin system VapC family toxin [Chitinophagales bacterium]|jgi:predicted nucleic acid-binding protein|nr:type II toxin-antitoxin system VapC family toxin [Sphingobacteriales bacterium]MBP6664012.1 type II toxin-antitoxin system VapC family toxin [Chitinophagales bacterium]MBP7533895.1 type II toxin-antitoxin system VapC family toxin [Chitinophagales bacterium]
MAQKWLIDTNIVIYYANDKIPSRSVKKVEEIIQQSFIISTITQIEVLGWYKITVAEKRRLTHFLNQATVLYVDKKIEQAAVALKQMQKMDTPDAIIAATCLVYGYTLVTRNSKDFTSIDYLKIYNPFN